MNRILITFLILVICLSIILYNTLCFKQNVEEFTFEKFENETTLSKYKSGFNFHEKDDIFYNFPKLQDVDEKKPLLTYGCINHNIDDLSIENYLKNNFLTSTIEYYSLSFNDVIENIMKDVEKNLKTIKNKNRMKTIQSPIYVLIYQAPFFEFHDKIYEVRADTVKNMMPSLKMTNEKNFVGKKPLFTKIHLIYTKYKQSDDGDIFLDSKGHDLFKAFMSKNISRDPICFMNCNKTGFYSCGCMNRDPKKVANKTIDFYESKCANSNKEKKDFGVVYMINQYNILFDKMIA